MNKIFVQKYLNVFLVIINLLFFTYYFAISYYSRLFFDDYNALDLVRNVGIWGFIHSAYFGFSGRFVNSFITALQFKTIELTKLHFYFPILFWLAGSFGLYVVLRKVINKLPKAMAVNLAMLIFNIFIIINIDFGLFFYQGAIFQYYLLPVFLVLLLLNVNIYKNSIQNNILLLVYGIILGGAHEAFTPFCFLFLLINIIYYLHIYNYSVKKLIQDSRIKRIVYVSSVMLVCFAIVVIAPGNYKRMRISDMHVATGYIHPIIYSFQATFIFFYFLIFKIPHLIVLFLIFSYIGTCCKGHVMININFPKFIKYSLLFYVFYVWLSTLPNAYLMSSFGIQRTYTHTIFFTIVLVCTSSFLWGQLIVNENLFRFSLRVLVFSLICLIFSLAFDIIYDIPKAKLYRDDDKKRIEYLLELKATNNKQLTIVKPLQLPYTVNSKYLFMKMIGQKKVIVPQLFYFNEFDTCANGRNNMAIEKYYNIGFPVVRSKE